MKKIARIALIAAGTVVALAVCLAAVGFAYNELSILSLRAQAGLRGGLYRVDGHDMRLYCSGSGAPALVLSSGLGDDGLVWSRTQAALSTTTRVCSYDRAGLGWSDARPDTADAKNVAVELHDLLHSASIPMPFVLAGHSISGVYIREYAKLYGHDLAGLVFVDGSTPLQDPLFPAVYAEIDRQRRSEAGWELATMTVGLDRLQGQCSQNLPHFEAYSRWLLADACIPGHFTQAQRELDGVPQSGEETVGSGPFGSLPILIFSRDPNVRRTDMPATDARTGSFLWDRLQARLLQLSTRSRRIIALHSDHYIFLDREQLVIRELKGFIEQIRKNSAPAQPYGSTVSE